MRILGVGQGRAALHTGAEAVARTLVEGAPYDGAPAAKALGLVYTPIEDTMRRTISWYLAQGLITRPLPGFTDSASDRAATA